MNQADHKRIIYKKIQYNYKSVKKNVQTKYDKKWDKIMSNIFFTKPISKLY